MEERELDRPCTSLIESIEHNNLNQPVREFTGNLDSM
jgi:hypothetical protein